MAGLEQLVRTAGRSLFQEGRIELLKEARLAMVRVKNTSIQAVRA